MFFEKLKLFQNQKACKNKEIEGLTKFLGRTHVFYLPFSVDKETSSFISVDSDIFTKNTTEELFKKHAEKNVEEMKIYREAKQDRMIAKQVKKGYEMFWEFCVNRKDVRNIYLYCYLCLVIQRERTQVIWSNNHGKNGPEQI